MDPRNCLCEIRTVQKLVTAVFSGVFNSFSSVTGFIGVYAAGYILHETESNWSYVFVFTSAQCILGAVVYSLMGTANRII